MKTKSQWSTRYYVPSLATIVFALIKGLSVLTLGFYMIYLYDNLLAQVVLFHFIKYAGFGLVILSLASIGRYPPTPKLLNIISIILSCFIVWDSLSWCDFLSSKLVIKDSVNLPRYFIAGNLYNNEAIFDTYRQELDRFIKLVGVKNVYISIVEDHSTDKTPLLLNNWSKELTLQGIQHKIITGFKTPNRNNVDRIERLAYIRNAALQPFFAPESGFIDPTTYNSTVSSLKLLPNIGQDSRIIFLNDIIFFKENLISLINTNKGEYDVVCASDYDDDRLYDLWVIRDQHGQQLNPNYPHFRQIHDADQWSAQLPVQVYSCWNGMIVMNPNLIMKHFSPKLLLDHPFPESLPSFTSPPLSQPIHFKNDLNPGIRFRAKLPHSEECYASECFYIFQDLHSRVTTPLRIFMNPNVPVFYNFRDFFRTREKLSWSLWRYYTKTYVYDPIHNHLLTYHPQLSEYACWDWNHGLVFRDTA